jgi:hypothetical protein
MRFHKLDRRDFTVPHHAGLFGRRRKTNVAIGHVSGFLTVVNEIIGIVSVE